MRSPHPLIATNGTRATITELHPNLIEAKVSLDRIETKLFQHQAFSPSRSISHDACFYTWDDLRGAFPNWRFRSSDQYVWKGESTPSAPWGLKIWSKNPKNAETRIIDDSLSDQPDREHGNQLRPDRTSGDVGKQLQKCDRRRISANFTRSKGSISYCSFEFRWIRR